jgi:hypothetical protein
MKTLICSVVISVFLIFLAPQTGQPCTSFFFNHNGNALFGKNYDWSAERALVIINEACQKLAKV